jgi:hypothetical protein
MNVGWLNLVQPGHIMDGNGIVAQRFLARQRRPHIQTAIHSPPFLVSEIIHDKYGTPLGRQLSANDLRLRLSFAMSGWADCDL